MNAKNTSKQATPVVFPVNVKALAASLVENTKNGKAVAFRHKGYLDLIAQSQGFENYKAMQSSGLSVEGDKPGSKEGKKEVSGFAALTETQIREVAQDIYGEAHIDDVRFYQALVALVENKTNVSGVKPKNNFISGSIYSVVANQAIETGCRVDAKTHKIEFPLGYKYVESDREFVVMGTDVRHVVRNPFNPLQAYALRTFEHYEQAVEKQLELVGSSSLYRFNGMTVEYGINGDWFADVESAFDSVEYIFDGSDGEEQYAAKSLSEALSGANIWFADSKVDFDIYEFYIDAMDFLFSEPSKKSLLIRCIGEGSLTIECLK